MKDASHSGLSNSTQLELATKTIASLVGNEAVRFFERVYPSANYILSIDKDIGTAVYRKLHLQKDGSWDVAYEKDGHPDRIIAQRLLHEPETRASTVINVGTDEESINSKIKELEEEFEYVYCFRDPKIEVHHSGDGLDKGNKRIELVYRHEGMTAERMNELLDHVVNKFVEPPRYLRSENINFGDNPRSEGFGHFGP
jgi:hypothetical protein